MSTIATPAASVIGGVDTHKHTASTATSSERSTRTCPDKPRTSCPRPLDKHRSIERSHRIDQEEFYRLLDGVLSEDANVLNDKLREWEDYYNYDAHMEASGLHPIRETTGRNEDLGRHRPTSVAQLVQPPRSSDHGGSRPTSVLSGPVRPSERKPPSTTNTCPVT